MRDESHNLSTNKEATMARPLTEVAKYRLNPKLLAW